MEVKLQETNDMATGIKPDAVDLKERHKSPLYERSSIFGILHFLILCIENALKLFSEMFLANQCIA